MMIRKLLLSSLWILPVMAFTEDAVMLAAADNEATNETSELVNNSQLNQGALILKIDPNGEADVIQASSSGDLIIQLQPGTYEASTTYTLMTCEAGFDSEFERVYFCVPGIGLQELSNATLTYGADALVLEITSPFTVEAPESAPTDEQPS